MSVAGHLFDSLLDELAERIAERIVRRDQSLVDQHDPRTLSPRWHIDVVRRRRAEGAGGAYQRNRDYLLTPEALREELERDTAGARPVARERIAATAESDELERLKRELEADMRAAGRRGNGEGES